MIAKQTKPMSGVMNISSAGFIEMKVIETAGESAKQRGARRDLPDERPNESHRPSAQSFE
jgi:hypothetical protein